LSHAQQGHITQQHPSGPGYLEFGLRFRKFRSKRSVDCLQHVSLCQDVGQRSLGLVLLVLGLGEPGCGGLDRGLTGPSGDHRHGCWRLAISLQRSFRQGIVLLHVIEV